MGPPSSSQGKMRLGHLAAAASLASIRHTARSPTGLCSSSGCCVNGFSFSELHPVKGSRVAFDWKQNKGKAEFCWTKSTRNNPYPNVFMVGNTAYLAWHVCRCCCILRNVFCLLLQNRATENRVLLVEFSSSVTQCFSNLYVHVTHWRSCDKCRFWFIRPKRSLRSCISNKLPGDAQMWSSAFE